MSMRSVRSRAKCRLRAAGHRLAAPVGGSLDAVAAFGGKHVLVAPAMKMPPDALLRAPIAARGVDEGEAAVERAVEQPRDLGLVEIVAADLNGRPYPSADTRSPANSLIRAFYATSPRRSTSSDLVSWLS